MNVQEVARTRWRYWGAGLGDVRGVVEDAVRSHGAESERLVIHGPTGSVIWPIEAGERLQLEAGDAYLGHCAAPGLARSRRWCLGHADLRRRREPGCGTRRAGSWPRRSVTVAATGESERLVIHGPSGSVIWPIEAGERLRLEVGDAFLGVARHPALRVRGEGAAATLTFADAASRDAALAELGRGRADR